MVGGRPKFGLSETLAAIKKFIFVPGQRRPSTKLDLQSFFSRGTGEGCWELLSTTTFIGNFFSEAANAKTSNDDFKIWKKGFIDLKCFTLADILEQKLPVSLVLICGLCLKIYQGWRT